MPACATSRGRMPHERAYRLNRQTVCSRRCRRPSVLHINRCRHPRTPLRGASQQQHACAGGCLQKTVSRCCAHWSAPTLHAMPRHVRPCHAAAARPCSPSMCRCSGVHPMARWSTPCLTSPMSPASKLPACGSCRRTRRRHHAGCLAAAAADPQRLAATRLRLHPACGWLACTHAAVDLWQAHTAPRRWNRPTLRASIPTMRDDALLWRDGDDPGAGRHIAARLRTALDALQAGARCCPSSLCRAMGGAARPPRSDSCGPRRGATAARRARASTSPAGMPACHRPARADRPGLHLLAVGPDQDRGTGAGSAGPAGCNGVGRVQQIRARTVPAASMRCRCCRPTGAALMAATAVCAAADANPRAGDAVAARWRARHDPGDPAVRVSAGVSDPRCMGGLRLAFAGPWRGRLALDQPLARKGSGGRAHDGRLSSATRLPATRCRLPSCRARSDAPDDWGAWMAAARRPATSGTIAACCGRSVPYLRDRAAHARAGRAEDAGAGDPAGGAWRAPHLRAGPAVPTVAVDHRHAPLHRHPAAAPARGCASATLALEAQADDAPDPLARLEQAQRGERPACGGGRAQPRAARCVRPLHFAGVVAARGGDHGRQRAGALKVASHRALKALRRALQGDEDAR